MTQWKTCNTVIEETLEEDGKGVTNIIIMGDRSIVVGGTSCPNIVGSLGLGRRNQRGQMLIDFCERDGLVTTNTWFKKPVRRLCTWEAPGDQNQHQLDYILVKHRFRNGMKSVQTLSGADGDSDRSLLLAKICSKLKKNIRFEEGKPRWDLQKCRML
jgi:hypothetical protein